MAESDTAAEKDSTGALPGEAAARSWIRKASSRRFLSGRNRQAETPPAASAPHYTPPGEPEWTPTFDLPPQKSRHGQGVGHSLPQHWWLGTIGTFIAVLALTLPAYQLDQGGRGHRAVFSAAAPAALQVPDASAGVAPGRAAIERFFAAVSPEEKAQHVRGGEKMLPAMTEYYAHRQDEPAGHTLASNVNFLIADHRMFIQFHGMIGNGRPFDTLVAMTPDGPKLDWRYLTGEGDMEWGRWLSEKPLHEVWQRAAAEPDDYYAGDFGDSSRWCCLRLSDISRTHTVWAYAERNGPLRLALLSLLRSPSAVRLQCGLRFPAHSGASSALQVQMTGIRDHGWLDQSPEAD